MSTRHFIISACSTGIAAIAIGSGALISNQAIADPAPASPRATATVIGVGNNGDKPFTCTFEDFTPPSLSIDFKPSLTETLPSDIKAPTPPEAAVFTVGVAPQLDSSVVDLPATRPAPGGAGIAFPDAMMTYDFANAERGTPAQCAELHSKIASRTGPGTVVATGVR